MAKKNSAAQQSSAAPEKEQRLAQARAEAAAARSAFLAKYQGKPQDEVPNAPGDAIFGEVDGKLVLVDYQPLPGEVIE